jgi:integrase
MLQVVGTINGKRIRKSTGLPKSRMVEAEVVRAKMELALLKGRGSDVVSFRAVAKRYEDRRGGLSKTQTGHLSRLLRYWDECEVDGIDQLAIDEYVSDVHRDNKDSTVRRELNAMKAIINYGHSRGLCKEAKFDLPPDGEGRCRYLSDAERDSLLGCCGGADSLKRELTFLMYTGARLGEMTNLTWSAINLDDSSVTMISKKGNRAKPKRRRVPLHQKVLDILGKFGKPSELVFIKINGQRWDKTSFYEKFYRATCESYIDDFTPHDCRHTFASHLVMNGADLRTVAELLGHSSLAMVMRYSHLSRGHLESAIGKL